MSRIIVYVVLVITLVLSASIPTARSEAEKYYVYEFSAQTFENGEPSLNYSIVVKFVEVNETAYRVEVLRYSGPESFERQVEAWIRTLENLTGGLVIIRKGLLLAYVAMQFLYTLRIDPGKFEAGREAANKLMEATGKLCSMSREDYAERQELVRKLYEENAEGIRVLDATFRILVSDILARDLISAGVNEETKYICNGGLTISVDELKDTYVFKLTISKTTSSSELLRTIETIYAKNGWLISSTYKENVKSKREDGSQYTRKVIETARLIDTNDETVKSIMESATNIEGLTGTGGSLSSISISTETAAIIIGIITVLALIVLALKKLS